ncbi:phage head closure protein [Sphingomonas sp. S2-65]|uniref:phage head closure protein n=1 Tax=Sphingomonas sp. S2-65 TaxID=2903960 RepID=UPI001F30FBA2|nr:phage head closure protein [Sphingomonas sp. S2-65]UYY60109.1 phage head closure protein [Sphingomonas sp. S2-65]
MPINSRELDRRITILRGAVEDTGFSKKVGAVEPIGGRWAKKTDVSDGERIAAAAQEQSITARFLVRHDDLTETVDGRDFLECEGRRYQVVSTKEARGRRVGIEISATALLPQR